MNSSSDLQFSNNYRDLCLQSGTGAGFQFEFYCQCCSDTWRSPFQPYRSGQASGWVREAGSFLGGLLGSLGGELNNAADGFANAGWGPARDSAFKQAIVAATGHFHRCGRCSHYVCDQCFNPASGACRSCAPDLSAEIEIARHAGTVQAATEQARQAGESMASGMDVKTSRVLVCPACHTETHGAKFCPQCGLNLATKAQCASCHHDLPAGSRFCPDCGTPVSAS